MKKHLLIASLFVSALAACKSGKDDNIVVANDILIENMDTTVNPATDFFAYANGGWIKKNPIPESERRWWIGNLVQNENYDRMKNLSEDASGNKNAQPGSNEQKIGDFYASGMDSINIESKGMGPLQKEFDAIKSIRNTDDLVAVIAHQQLIGVGSLFTFFVSQDEMNSDVMALHFYQGGIGLPNRDYYFNTDSRTQNIRAEYVKHLEHMFRLLGDDEKTSMKNSQAVMKMETALAKSSRKLEDLRDPYLNYNKRSVSDFEKITPTLRWSTLLTTMQVPHVDSVIIGQPDFYKEVELSFKSVSLDDWKSYLRWHLIHSFAGELSSAFDQEDFHFYRTVMSGVKVQRPRWKRVLDNEEGFLGDALGQLYVEKYYSPKTRQRYKELTDNTLAAFKERIEKLDWMSGATKEKET